MKKYILMMLMLLGIINLFAAPQTLQIARQVADNFISSRSKNLQIEEVYSISNDRNNSVYIFNYKPFAFVAVSADNDLFPVMAYSFKNQLSQQVGEENLIYKMMKDDVPLRIEYYKENQKLAQQNRLIWREYLNNNITNRTFQQWPAEGSTGTDGWIETRWTQTGVYNRFCPLDNSNQRSVVGCVATAMAMIIDFHKDIGDVSFNNSDDYNSGDGGYIDNQFEARDYPSFPELNDYLDVLAEHYQNGEVMTPNDKSALNFACGVAVEMYYSSSGSGAYTSSVAGALLNKFDFHTASWLENNGATFYNYLSNNMKSMQPAEMSIYTAGWNSGHAIICDGYNTDNYYHLNYGWGTSNSSCWYSLPYGMPSNYSIIGGAVINIEGGDIPISVSGNIDITGASPIGIYVTLEGDNFYENYITSANGNFQIEGVIEGDYTVTAISQDRIFYDSFDIYLSGTSNFIQFEMGNYEAVTGVVIAPINTQDCVITLWQDGELMYSGIADNSGFFTISEVLPGDYIANASLDGNYFEQKDVTITLENQTIEFELEEFPGNIGISYAGPSIEILELLQQVPITAAIRITSDELEPMVGDVISKVRFKSPIDDSEGEIKVQIWEGSTLLSENSVENFSIGEWVESELNNYILIESESDYYIGYEIYSSSGNFSFYDAGPRVAGKGAYFKLSNWVELSPVNYDVNFCIDAVIISQEFGTVSGNVDISSGNGNISDVVISTQNYSAHTDEEGNYEISLKIGTYNLKAALTEYTPEIFSGLEIENETQLANIDFALTYGVSNDPDIIQADSKLIENYPNPFNPSTTISFSINTNNTEDTELIIYNMKGQKVRTFPVNQSTNLPVYHIIWDGKDRFNKAVSSGVYFYKLKVGSFEQTKKMILMK